MSVFHRVDDIEAIPVSRLVPLMVRLQVYDGAVRFAARQPEVASRRNPEPVTSGPALTADQLQALNANPLYGPMQGQTVGLFDVVKVPAE